MTLNTQLADLVRYRNAYFLALSAAMGSVFFGYDMYVHRPRGSLQVAGY